MRVPATPRAAGLASNAQHCCYGGTGQKADHEAGTRRAGKTIDAQRVDIHTKKPYFTFLGSIRAN